MNRVRWHALLATGLMLATSALSYFGKPSTYLADQIGKPDLEAIFPARFGSWRVDASIPIILPAPDVQAELNAIYNQVLARTYVNASGQRIMLSVAYGGDQYDGTSAHRPEGCYPAQGFDITANEKAVQPVADGLLAVRRLMSRRGARHEPITYWVVVGSKVATTGIEQKLAQMRYGLRGVIADGMLVRVSSIDADMARGHAVQAGFISDMAAGMTGPVRPRVFGELRL
jgi:EpsI family protein